MLTANTENSLRSPREPNVVKKVDTPGLFGKHFHIFTRVIGYIGVSNKMAPDSRICNRRSARFEDGNISRTRISVDLKSLCIIVACLIVWSCGNAPAQAPDADPATPAGESITQDPGVPENNGGPEKADSEPEQDKAPEASEKKADTAPQVEEPKSPVPTPSDADDSAADEPTVLMKQAAALGKAGHFSSALGKYKTAIKKAAASSDQKLLAAALSGAARMSHQAGNDAEALEFVNSAINLNLVLKNAQARSLDFFFAGQIFLQQSNYSNALKYFEESLKILPTSEASVMPQLLESLAQCRLRLYQQPEALAAYAKLLSVTSKNGNELEAARINVLVGDLQVSRSEYKTAKSHFKKAEKTYRDLKHNKQLADTLFRLAYLEQILGETASARKNLEEGASLTEGESSTDSLPLVVKGMAAYNEGKIIVAVKNLTTALNQYEKSGDLIMAARVRLMLGHVELERGKLMPALELAGKSLEQFRQIAFPGGEAGALLLVAEVYYRQGFIHKSLEYAQESLAISKKVSDRDQAAMAGVLLFEIYSGLGDLDACLKFLKEALEDVKLGTGKRTRGNVYLSVAKFRLIREASDKALSDVAEARKDFTEVRDAGGLADCEHVSGLIFELRNEKDKALKSLTRALEEHRALSDRFGEGRDLTALGVHYKNSGDHDKALEYFTAALDLRKGIGDRRGYAANLANIGILLRHRNRISEAMQNLEQALAIYKELSDKKGEADLLTNLGNVDAGSGNQAAALEKFAAALKLHRETQDNRGMATDLVGLGRLYLAKGDLQNASENLEEAEKINKKIRNPSGDIAILSELAMLNRAKGNNKKSIELLQQALDLAGQAGDVRSVSSIKLKMCSVLEDSSDNPRTLALLKETLTAMRDQGDKKGELWALGSIGIIQTKMEDYENALKNLHEAVKLRSELGIGPTQTRDLDFYLGEIYEGFKDFERALDYYHKALTAAQNLGNDGSSGRIYDRIGNIYYRLEDYSKAKEFFEDALRVHSETRNMAAQKIELIRLGDILSKLGDSEGALKYQNRALILTRDSGDEKNECKVLTRIGTLNQVLGRQKIALESYREAKDKRTKLGDKRGVNENLLQIALVTSILGDFESAVADLKRAFEIAHCSEDRGMLWKAYFIMGRALEGKNNLGEALESYRKAIAILESMESDTIEESEEDDFIFGGKPALFDTSLRVLMKLAKKDPEGAYDNQALRIVEKLKAAEFENTLSRINIDSFSDLPHDLLIKEKSLKLNLKNINQRLAAELSKTQTDQTVINKLLEDRRAKEKAFINLKERLFKEYSAYAELKYPRPVSIHQFQKNTVNTDEVILEYLVTRSRTYIFAVDKFRFQTFSVDYPSNELERDIDALTRPLYRADTQASWDPSVAYRLYSKLIGPVEKFLSDKKVIVVMPHGPLSALPFEVLVCSKAHATKRFWSVSDKPTYLLEKFAFSYSPSIAVLSQLRARKKKTEPGWNLVAFGDASYQEEGKTGELNPGADKLITSLVAGPRGSRGIELKPLPGTRKEITEIVKILGGPIQTYFGAEATETLFKKADLTRYNYVHLATHGVLTSGIGKLQQQPAIVFSLYGDGENDGFLQLGEVFGLKLNADLTVLSSCLVPAKTGPGESNNLVGLARAFLFAGSDSVILSMWQVNDESTANLFIEMYRNLKENSKAEALRQAKLTLLKSSRTSHPYYWAPFVLIGNWTVTSPPVSNSVDPIHVPHDGLSRWKRLLNM